MSRSLDFLAPSLYPNTLSDLSLPEPTPGAGPSREPIVRQLAIKHGRFQPVGHIKRVVLDSGNHAILLDDAFRISRLSLGGVEDPRPPQVVAQHLTSATSGAVWAGTANTAGGLVAGTTDGALTLFPTDPSSSGVKTSNGPRSTLCLASSSSTASTFALAGKEVDVSIRDIERTFSSSEPANGDTVKRKNDLDVGETWRAENMPLNALRVRPPIHHLCLIYLAGLDTQLASGTKAGTIRRYDARQRKPVAEWKAAKEGGVGSVVCRTEHELFFADRTNQVGCLDLRAGKLLYSYSTVGATAHAIVPLPTPPTGSDSSNVGLASIWSDATLRLHSVREPRPEFAKGNSNGTKAAIVGMLGGVGVGGFAFKGWGTMPTEETVKADGGDEDGAEEEDDGDEDEGMWEGMDDVEEAEDEEDDDEKDREDGDSDGHPDFAPRKKRKT